MTAHYVMRIAPSSDGIVTYVLSKVVEGIGCTLQASAAMATRCNWIFYR